MSQVSRQANANIQPGKVASATDIAAELNHYLEGINDNDDRITVNEALLVTHTSEISSLQLGELTVSTLDFTSSNQSYTVGSGGIVYLTNLSATYNALTIPNPSGFPDGDSLKIISDGSYDSWVLATTHVTGLGLETTFAASEVVVLVNADGTTWTLQAPAYPEINSNMSRNFGLLPVGGVGEGKSDMELLTLFIGGVNYGVVDPQVSVSDDAFFDVDISALAVGIHQVRMTVQYDDGGGLASEGIMDSGDEWLMTKVSHLNRFIFHGTMTWTDYGTEEELEFSNCYYYTSR